MRYFYEDTSRYMKHTDLDNEDYVSLLREDHKYSCWHSLKVLEVVGIAVPRLPLYLVGFVMKTPWKLLTHAEQRQFVDRILFLVEKGYLVLQPGQDVLQLAREM